MGDKPGESISGLDRLRAGASQLVQSARETASTVVADVKRDGPQATIQRYSQQVSQAGAGVIVETQRDITETAGRRLTSYIDSQVDGGASKPEQPTAPTTPYNGGGGRATPTYSQQDKIDTCRAIERDQGGKPYAPCDKILRGNKKGPGM